MIGGLFYAAIYVLALATGLPLGFALFGRRHAGGWIAGALFGYVLAALAIWVPIRLGIASASTFALACLAVAGASWLACRGMTAPAVDLHPWTRRDTRALAAVWLVTLTIAVPPFWRVGEIDAAGSQRYRAYFTADFVWHTALTAEMTKFTSPPRNPYLAQRPIHYYWGYFLLPAAVAGTAPHAVHPFNEVQACLKVNAVGTALLFVSAIFLCAWASLPRAWPVAAAVLLAIVASSAEGLFALWRFWSHGQPLAEVRNLNIDAISNWWFSGLRVDGLPRCFWWVPQHSMGYALGLIGLTAVNAAGSAGSLASIVLAGVALGGAALMNPFIGGIFSLAWGASVAIHAAGSGAFVSRLLRHAIAAIPVALAMAWCIGNRMVEGGGSALQLGWLGDARNAPVVTLILSLGPVLAAAFVGVLAPRAAVPGSAWPMASLVLAGTSLAVLYFARLNVDPSWVGFRAGQMFLAAVPALVARGLAAPGSWRRIAVAVAMVSLLAGAPTTAIDAYNAQDVTNFGDSAIGPWTIVITPSQQRAFAWIRANTPPDAVVQMDPIARGRSTWSLIPSFAGRRMAAGLPISLLNTPEYHERSDRVRLMYGSPDAAEAWQIARKLRIDYVYVDDVERAAYPNVAKFDASPERFERVFADSGVNVYRVR